MTHPKLSILVARTSLAALGLGTETLLYGIPVGDTVKFHAHERRYYETSELWGYGINCGRPVVIPAELVEAVIYGN
jgi:hypothetical protein